MANQFQVAEHLEPYILIPASVSVADALISLRQAHEDFAVIVDADQPQALVLEDDLANLNAEQRVLAEVLNQFPPSLVIDGSIVALDNNALKQVSLLLEQTNAPGLIVYQDRRVTGVISLDVIAEAVPFSAIPPTNIRNLYGDPVTPARPYICHRCERDDPPAPIALPRQGDVPICPKHWLHGLMDPM